MSEKAVAVILSGGAGSRLWPVSRDMHPKPFMRLSDGQSLLQKAFLRCNNISGISEILTVTNCDLFFKTKDELEEIKKLMHADINYSFILEPFGRNTAPAIAAAALQVKEALGGDALLLVLAADHLIEKQPEFAAAVQQAFALAKTGKLVTFGIKPTAPETGYGYLEVKENKVLQFVEKPSLQLAQEYVKAGNFFWNAGMFCFSADAILQAMKKSCSAILSSVTTCVQKASRYSGEFPQLEIKAKDFASVPSDSIDYAVMEKSANVAAVPCDIGWSDVGSWNAISDLVVKDSDSNSIVGQALLHNSSNCHIVNSDDRMIGVVGVKDLLIIDTPDALLIANRDSAQDVKNIYNQLKKIDHDAYKLHRTVHRPWGTYTVLDGGERYKIKRIEVKPKASLSLQLHHHRSEHWVVVQGMAKITNGDSEKFISTNESTYIPAGHQHRLENPGILNLVMIEVQSGEYLGEDDIVRLEDNYGRV